MSDIYLNINDDDDDDDKLTEEQLNLTRAKILKRLEENDYAVIEFGKPLPSNTTYYDLAIQKIKDNIPFASDSALSIYKDNKLKKQKEKQEKEKANRDQGKFPISLLDGFDVDEFFKKISKQHEDKYVLGSRVQQAHDALIKEFPEIKSRINLASVILAKYDSANLNNTLLEFTNELKEAVPFLHLEFYKDVEIDFDPKKSLSELISNCVIYLNCYESDYFNEVIQKKLTDIQNKLADI